jgi:ribonuclease-3
MQEFFKILENYKITPKNESLYIMALTHPSYQFEKKINYSNQRLEFLGDAIISKIVAEYLYKKHQQMDDGKMSAARAMIVQSKTLIKAGYELELEKYMLTGASIKNMKIFPEKIIEDCFESLCAAIYLDNNENTLYKLLKRTIIHYYETN